MEENLSSFQTSALSGSDILFPALLWYLEFLIAYVVFAAVVIGWKFVQKKHNKD
jgi:hypothetical protein